MPSLAAHLHEADAHDRLPFHPSCPICRETRLTGQVPADELVSPRTQALLAAGVLAISASAPAAVAVAAEQDRQQEGSASVGQSGGNDPADDPDFDPGGEKTDLPQTASAGPQNQAPADPANDDAAPVDQTAATNPVDPVVDPGDGSDSTEAAPGVSTQPTTTPADPSAAPTSAPTPAPPTPDTTTPASSAPSQVTTPEASAPPAAQPRAVRRASRSSRAGQRTHRPVKTTHQQQSSGETAAPVAPPAPAPAVAANAATVPVAVKGDHAEPGDSAHTVLAGESLWTIATDLLGTDASTAKVAREVHRIWQLNRDRIGTGDPDLLMIGTRLELR